MKYFVYCSGPNRSQHSMQRIYDAVQRMKGLAMARYGGRYQDALDAAFFHILDNFDESLATGDDGLDHYVASVVSKICRGSRREVLSDTVLDIVSDNQAVAESHMENPYEKIELNASEEFERNVISCMDALVPNFLKDYELFNGNSSVERKTNYRPIYASFTDAVVMEAVVRLKAYYEDAKYLNSLSRQCKMRTFSPDRYKSSLDEAIQFTGFVNGIAVCTYATSRIKRSVYRVHIMEFIEEVLRLFYYGEAPLGKRTIHGHDIYCTLSGKLVDGLDALREAIETDILGALLARVVNFRIVNYNKGSQLLVSSAKPEEHGIIFRIFNTDVVLELSRLTVRRVVLQEC